VNAMSPEEIRAAIAASTELLALVPNTEALASVLSEGRTRLEPREIGIGTILMVLAPDGGAFLDGLQVLGETDRNVFWSMELIRQGRFDVGLSGTRQQMLALAQQMPGLSSAFAALLGLAEVPDPVSEFKVRCAIYADDGTLRV